MLPAVALATVFGHMTHGSGGGSAAGEDDDPMQVDAPHPMRTFAERKKAAQQRLRDDAEHLVLPRLQRAGGAGSSVVIPPPSASVDAPSTASSASVEVAPKKAHFCEDCKIPLFRSEAWIGDVGGHDWRGGLMCLCYVCSDVLKWPFASPVPS